MNQTTIGTGPVSTAMRQKDIRPAPAEIEYKGFKFLITDRPSDTNIHAYIQVRHITISPYRTFITK